MVFAWRDVRVSPTCERHFIRLEALVAQQIRRDEVFRAVLASSRSGDGAQGIAEATWQGLDWPLLCSRLSALCSTEDAKELALHLGVLPPSLVQARAQEVDEAMQLRVRGSRPPIGDVPMLRHAILRCKKVDALEADDLLGLAALLVATARVRRFFLSHDERAPMLANHADRLVMHDDISTDIRATFDDAGLMRDEASPELSRLRRRYRRVRDSILARTDKYLRDPRYAGILQEDFVTLRDERFVLPVRAGERGDVKGIVHGQSGSGGTLFIEPEELVPLNNELAIVQSEVAVEERRIRMALTQRLRQVIAEIEFNADMLAFLDLTNAQAALGDEMGAHHPVITSKGPAFHLRAARHPILALRSNSEAFTVVPNDIEIGADVRALVISGPNTGGKTVTLKTIGLFALMLRAGFAVPASPDTEMRIVGRVFTDIGDEQSIQADLSTFSGHVANIASFVGRIEEGDLVLLDELFAGTDPAQATTLGRALIDDLIGRGAFVVVTTHLEGLKSIAFEDERYAAASMGFDIDRMAPTYRLRAGVPGASWAHRIALRLGMPAAIVERAERMEAPMASMVDETQLARIEDALRQADDAKAAAEKLQRQAASDREAAAEELALARDRQRRQLDEEVEKARRENAAMRRDVRELQRKLRELIEAERPSDEEAERIIAEARQTARRVEERNAAQKAGPHESRPAPQINELAVGDRVWIIPYQHYGQISERIADPNSIAVQMGPVLVRVRLDQLRLAESEAVAPSRKLATAPARPRAGEEDLSYRVDLRGQRVEDAEEMVEAYMRRAELSSLPFVMFIHGHGTGALRRAVRSRLRDLPYSLRVRPGEQGEGGEGVTIAEFVSKALADE